MTRLPSLYKCRGIPLKSPICAICVDRTRGRTQIRELTHGVRVSLCEGHNSLAFMRKNAGRDFVVSLSRIWGAQGCLTLARTHALASHLRALKAGGRRLARARPGSYAWPKLRREAEERFARGDGVVATILGLRERHSADHAQVPSIRTMRRWFSQGRWLRLPEPEAGRSWGAGPPAAPQTISSGSSSGGRPSASRQARISGGSLFSETIT
jgi:hypothetical protein